MDTNKELVGTLELARCHECGTWFFLGEDPVIGYQHEGFNPNFWKYYVHVGAGIDFMLRPLLALGDFAEGGQLIDVGCGFGFVPDFWRRTGRGKAAGLEAASYGRVGQSLLGVDIYPDLLSDCAQIKGTTFDIVYSSEVIEHVRDPHDFLRQLTAVMAPEGVMILTTPSASCIRRDFDISSLHAALSPGYHYFILSKRALEMLLAEAGLPHAVVLDTGDRLIAWASRVEFPTPDLNRFDYDVYLNYLNSISGISDVNVSGGTLYRLLKDSLNTGRNEKYASAFARLENIAKENYGIDFDFPNISNALHTHGFFDYLDKYPCWLGGAFYYAGIYAGNVLKDARRKMRLLEASTHLLRHSMDIGLEFAQEAAALLPVATYDYRIALAENLEAEFPRGLDLEILDPAARPSANQISQFSHRVGALAATITSTLHPGSPPSPKAKAKRKRMKIVKRWLDRWRN